MSKYIRPCLVDPTGSEYLIGDGGYPSELTVDSSMVASKRLASYLTRLRSGYMKDLTNSKGLSVRGMAIMATAIGAVAVGAFAIGALAIGRLAIRRIAVESGKFKSLEIQDLTVTRLHAAEVIVSDSLKLPGDVGDKLSA